LGNIGDLGEHFGNIGELWGTSGEHATCVKSRSFSNYARKMSVLVQKIKKRESFLFFFLLLKCGFRV
jgi:hypothetical protein